MAEKKDMNPTSPARTPKSQLAAEQPSTGRCWNPPEKDTPHLRAKENQQRNGSQLCDLEPDPELNEPMSHAMQGHPRCMGQQGEL